MKKLLLALACLAPIAAHGQPAAPDSSAMAQTIAKLKALQAQQPTDCVSDSICWGKKMGAEIRRIIDQTPEHCSTLALGGTNFGGTLCAWGGMYKWTAESGAVTLHRAEQIDRRSVRCVERSRLLFVNDALNTRQELYSQCMRLELSQEW